MPASSSASSSTDTFATFAEHVDYSLLSQLTPDPEATVNGHDHQVRQVRSGHYVPVIPTPLPAPQYVAHSNELFLSLIHI